MQVDPELGAVEKGFPVLAGKAQQFIWLTALCLLSSACLGGASTDDNSWELLVGYGESHPGWGATRERVETRDLILRRVLPEPSTHGSGWYFNRRSVQIELPVHLLQTPREPPMIGVYFNSCWTFLAHPRYRPYLLVGGGPLYTHAEIPGTSSRLKGSYQAGAGLKIKLETASLNLEYRLHHVSNGGIEKPNDPLNSSKLLVGFQLPF